MTGQDKDYTTGCFFPYEYIKNHYRLIAVDLSRQKESDAGPKVIQKIEFVGNWKKTTTNKLDNNGNGTDPAAV